jgi:Caspase domain
MWRSTGTTFDTPPATGAARDASALHALFSDTFNDIRSMLLLDEAATVDEIRAALDETLGWASEDDAVVLTFAGHGTPGHQIIAYDTDPDSPGDTTLPMDELAARFPVRRPNDLEGVIAFRAAPKMKDMSLIPILGSFGGNQLIAASNAVCPEA